MPDFGAPVAAGITPPDPTQGLQKLSDILQLQQQQQQLRTGTAQASQAQQQNSELQALASFTRSAVSDPQYHNADGSLNTQKFQTDAQTVAPVYGQVYIGQATTNANEAIRNRDALLSLSNKQRETTGNYLGSYATNAHADPRGDFLDMGQQALAVSDDPAYQRMVLGFIMHAPDVSKLPTTQADQVLRQYARTAAVATQAPAASQSAPVVENYTTKSGDLGTRQVSPQSPMGMGAFGPTTPQGLAPTVVAGPSQVPTVVKGSSATAAAGAGAGGGPTPTGQDWTNFGAYQANLNNRVAVASDSIPRIQQAEQALAQIRSGHGAQGYARLGQLLQAVGAPQSLIDGVSNGSLAASQEAEKYLFQTTFSGLRQAMQGDPARVAEFQSAEQVFPSIGTDPRAAQAVLNFMVQQGQRDYAEQQALNTARKNGTFNPVTWQADYQAQLRAGKVPGVPSSQVPGSLKQMPTGARLQAYADKYFKGDLAKAKSALSGYGYQ